MLGLVAVRGWAQIPTREERIRVSSVNPDYYGWRARKLRLWPMPEKEDGKLPVACYRHDFELSSAPLTGRVSVRPVPTQGCRLALNGKTLFEPMPGRVGAIRTVDITDALKAGHNVLTFTCDAPLQGFGAHLLLEGIVFGSDGSVTRLLTDEGWRGGWDLAPGWDAVDADASSLPLAEVNDRRSEKMLETLNPPYYGRIQVQPAGSEAPIFDEDKPVDLDVTVVNGAAMAAWGTAGADKPGRGVVLAYDILNEHTRETAGTGMVDLEPRGTLDLAGPLRLESLSKGAYQVRFVLSGGGEKVDRRNYEIVVIGDIEQRMVDGTSYTDGMELRQVATIDCTAQPEQGAFIAAYHTGAPVETVVKEGRAGRYRTFVEARAYQNFAYRYQVDKLFVPHLVEVEWPDDADRGILVQVYEPTSMLPWSSKWARPGFRAGCQRGETAIVCTDDHPRRTNRMQTLRLVYWPNEKDASVHIWNTHGADARAAASRVTVYEIVNDLPALRIRDAGERMIGYHTERGPQTMTASYYAGPVGAWFSYGLAGNRHPEFYRNWYTTTENMIKRMRFSGQNAYLMGHFMYTGTLYPTQRYIFAQNTYSGGDATGDYIELILRMFERHGMSLMSGIEYVNTPDLAAEFPATLEEVVKTGAPTVYTINKDAKVSGLHGYSKWKGLNYFHPRVQESILTIVRELTDLYKDYPAWKGIAFILSRNFGPMAPFGGHHDSALNYGYEDYTVNLFEQDAGLDIPVKPLDPARFGKRYNWIMEHAREEWVDWRCDQYTKLYRRFRDVLVRGRPDLKLFLINFEPMNFTEEAAELVGRYDDPQAMKEVVKHFGFDVDALGREQGVVLSYGYISPGTGGALGADKRVYHDLNRSATWHNLHANDGKGGAYIWSGIPHYGARFEKDAWLFEYPLVRQGYLWPRYFADAFVNVMLRSNPTWMPHTWMDVAESGGRLHDLRLFARAYRSLPNGAYERLTGNGLDRNLWVSVARVRRVDYGVAANTDWWDLDVTLKLAGGVRLHDVISDRPVAIEDGCWTFSLGPYEVRTFRIDGRVPADGAAITGADTIVRHGPAAQIREALVEARSVLERAEARSADLKELPGWEAVPLLEELTRRVEQRHAEGDIAGAYETASSWQMEKARLRVVNEAMEAIPFIVLGPFGREADTAAPPVSYYEVVPGYEGLETPYLDEFKEAAGRKLPDLVPGFRPEEGATREVYPGKKATWQVTAKTDYLSFHGTANSPHPFWMVAYAYMEVYSPTARDADIWAGSDHALAIWCNDKLVLQHGGHGTSRGGQRPAGARQNKGHVNFEQGWNRVLIKAVQRGLARVYFRITDKQGQGMDDLKFRVPTAS